MKEDPFTQVTVSEETYNALRKRATEVLRMHIENGNIKPKGRCYECAFNYLKRVSKEEAHRYRLVHGEVFSEEVGFRYGHAWVEKDNNIVLDMRNDLRKKPLESPKETYYSENKVDEKTVKRYTQKQMWEVGAKEGGHYGPWGRGFRGGYPSLMKAHHRQDSDQN